VEDATLMVEARAETMAIKAPGALATGCDDAALVARAQAGEAAAFDQLYLRHADQVYNLCLNLCTNPEEARDLLQETFVSAWRGLPNFAGRAAFSTWLYRIAINACRMALRRKPPAPEAILPAPSVDQALVECVRAALATLRPPHRIVLTLHYTQGLSYQEIAACLDWSLPRVRSTLARARTAFKAAFVVGRRIPSDEVQDGS
jgi:RNA polymerase sigma-70 factor, ECF subfamily